eukprot:CAMPEP_0206495890 /NCGR_PEP_ID=MMETSP0324_2-20121206/48955_1 /ASSEMBLY_ACC=CAM_ASM_000836 /TAXON_ID=2866 /ORGANISM="Crypthecodinium cohnii, Strain Seligo" /LENGTH=52 /DNA_ID=CAMNT_0053980547 /DNA_START=70 /DNA_END=225 /DNA_ORIENTATION=+
MTGHDMTTGQKTEDRTSKVVMDRRQGRDYGKWARISWGRERGEGWDWMDGGG